MSTLLALVLALSAPAGEEVAARGLETTVTFAEYDALVRDRHALSETGRASLRHLLRARMLEKLAAESRLEVPDEEVEARWREIERQVIASGEGSGMEDYLRRNRVDPETMRRFLRLGIVQETLARRALGIPEGRPVPGEQQEMWLDQVMAQRGEQLPAPPWEGADPVVARCGDLEVRLSAFLPHLRDQIAEEDVREDCYQLLLAKRLSARAHDFAPEAVARAIDAELDRRRREFAADPEHQGLTYDQVMAASGIRLDRLREDPAIVIGALSKLWVERSHGEEGLRAAYRAEQEYFDGRFGPSVEVSVIFLQAAVLKNDLNPRSFAEAELELARLAEGIDSPEAFAAAAKERSEDAGTREQGGRLGPVTAADERVPEPLRRLAFGSPGAGLVGPVRLSSGAALLWIGPLRPAPSWEVMRGHVENELRRRLLDEVLPREAVTTWLDE